MRARFEQTTDLLTIFLDGTIDYETQDVVKAEMEKTIRSAKQKNPNQQVVVNFKGLQFVGSVGITHFVDQLKTLQKDCDIRPRYAGMKSEFQRIVKAFDEEHLLDIMDEPKRTRGNA